MAKGRMINRTLAYDSKFYSLTRDEQWLFMRMLPFADDEGKLPGDIIELRLLTIPGENMKDQTIKKLLEGLKRSKLLKINYGVVIQYSGWSKNQKIGHNPAISLYPDIVKDTEEANSSSELLEEGRNNITESNITELNITFNQFWEVYDKKVGKELCKKKWESLTGDERHSVMDYIPKYKELTPDKQYRKDPIRFLRHKAWEDELPQSGDEKIKVRCIDEKCNYKTTVKRSELETEKCFHCGRKLKERKA